MSERPDGYYWVRQGHRWRIMLFLSPLFWEGDFSFQKSQFSEIGPLCNRDDAEQ